jgi:hypothetical protein
MNKEEMAKEISEELSTLKALKARAAARNKEV